MSVVIISMIIFAHRSSSYIDDWYNCGVGGSGGGGGGSSDDSYDDGE